MSDTSSGFIELGSERLAYVRDGERPSVVLLHGIPTSKYLWRNVASVLSNAGLGWIAFDLLGYGDSSKPVDVDLGIANQAKLIGEALEQLGWKSGLVVGHDIGGGVAQLLAASRPALVEKLVLVDSIAYDSFPEPGIARLKEPVWDQILGAEDFDLRKGLTKGFQRGMTRQSEVSEALIAQYARPFDGVEGRKAYLRVARALRTEELVSRTAEIEQLPIPVLIVWGAQDAFQPLAYGEKLAHAMQNARLEVVEDAGHFLPEDAPGLLGKMIVDFATS
jgi:pimeloyl-ACP methyl ester carboxylesterase